MTFKCQTCGQEHNADWLKTDGAYPLQDFREEEWEYVAPITEDMMYSLFGITCPQHKAMVGGLHNKCFVVYATSRHGYHAYAVYNHDGNLWIICGNGKAVQRFSKVKSFVEANDFADASFADLKAER